jgi:hypothetical protein
MQINPEILKYRGWMEHEIDEVFNILERVESKKSPVVRFTEEVVIWLLLIIVILATAIFAIIITPFIIIATGKVIYPLIGLFGLTKSILFVNVLKDMEKVKKHHHFIISMSIVIFTFLIFSGVIFLINNSGIHNLSNASTDFRIMGIVYVTAFFIPYIAFMMHNNKNNKGRRKQ